MSGEFSNCGYNFPTLARKPIAEGCINELYYLEIEFPCIKKVSAIKIGGNVVSAFSFTLAYRNMYAAGVWTYIKSGRYSREIRQMDISTCQLIEHVYKIRPLLVTSGLRLYPQSWGDKGSSLKVDILACNLTLPVSSEMECKNSTQTCDMKEEGYVGKKP
ncbi:uncharacterized protein [Anabrus simplex]|uniref:uncharacterized protein n=1 Tax=Anabrus simplex TaxID=316456 RepID=UPI0035A352D8